MPNDRCQGLIVARKPGNPPTPKTPAIDHGTIRELAKLLDETGLTEIEIRSGRRVDPRRA